MNKVSLIDLNFKDFSVEEKRVSFTLMDVTLKKLHAKNLMVVDFDPHKIYFQDGIYFFEKVSPITNYNVNNKNEAILRNVLGLSNLAFCSYLPDYRLEQGLLNFEVIHNHFNDFSSIFTDEDRDYYKSILVNSYQNDKLPDDSVYYSDYIIKKHKDNVSKGKNTSLAFVKATEAGKAFANKDEAAFGSRFFFITVVSSLIVICTGLILYFLNI